MSLRIILLTAVAMFVFCSGLQLRSTAAPPRIQIERTINIGPVTYLPPHTWGDNEFAGHGPDVYTWAQIFPDNGRLIARVYMWARETQSDWTQAHGHQDFVVYTATQVAGLANGQDHATEYRYRDDNEEEDRSQFFTPPEPVRRFVCVGDTHGRDVGVTTKVTVEFNPIRIRSWQ